MSTPEPRPRAWRPAFYYLGHAALAALVLASLPPIRDYPLRVPITYKLDGLFLTTLAKAIREHGPFYSPTIGAPFGTELMDWPIGMWLPFAQMAGLTAVAGEPGTAVNLYWMSTILVAGLCATYAFRRLRLGRGLAFVLGMLYAFQPYAFYRNVEHVNLTFPFVPLLALLTLRVAGTRPRDEDRRERALTLAACALQGLSYIYYSAFACLLLAAAAPLGWLRTKSLVPLRRAALAMLLLVACSAATVAPTLVYWKRHGYNPDLDYKPPRETETYALKIRHLLTPIDGHPLKPLRQAAAALEAARFEGDNENALSRLGSVGSLGFLALLMFAVGRAGGLLGRRDHALDGAAALTLATLLWGTVGGLATFFSVFVMSDIRAYGRIVVFLSFYALLAFGTLLARAAARLPFRRGPALHWAALLLLLLGGLWDEIPVEHLQGLRAGTVQAFAEERGFVRELERRLAPGAMVFQLPHMTVPVDRATYPPMLYYDPGRAFVHSRTLRWSWGAMIGRHHDWGRAVDALPLPEKLRVLALAGFSGIWIDRWGFTGKERPGYPELEAELAANVGEDLVASEAGRYSFVSLVAYRQRLEEAGLGPERLARARAELLADMPIARWSFGCGDEEPVSGEWRRSCGPAATLLVRNWRPGPIAVTLSARLRADEADGLLRVRAPDLDEAVRLGPTSVRFECRFEVPGEEALSVLLWRESTTAAAAAAGFEIVDLRIRTQRLVRGVPVNEDGGVARRTRY